MISIIVPVYNAERYVRECIESVTQQSYADFELLLIDDGSTDNSPSICDKYALTDSRIRVFHQENQGVATARNNGIKNAKGEYIAFLDADDKWDSSFLKCLLKNLNPTNLPICNVIRFNDQTENKPEEKPDDHEWCWPIIKGYDVSCWRGLFQKNTLLENEIWFSTGRRTGEDQEFTLKYMIHMDHVFFVERALYYYRMNPLSVMHQRDRRHFDAVDAMQSFLEYAACKLSDDKLEIIREHIQDYRIPRLIDFAATTVLAGGEKPKEVLHFMHEKGYDSMLSDALSGAEHYRSNFMRLWDISPVLCTNYIYERKRIGQKLRRLKLIK